MKKLDVLFISSWYPSKIHPTLGNFVQKHANAIHPFVNLKVLYVTSTQNISKDFEIENELIDGVDTTIVYYKKVNGGLPGIKSITKFKKYLSAYKKGFAFITQKNNLKFDLVHCNVTFQSSVFARYLKSKYQIPYIISEHASLFSPLTGGYKKLNIAYKNLIKKGIKNAEMVTTVSEFLKNSMLDLKLTNHYQVIPNVVDTELFRPIELKKVKTDKIEILHVSHLDNDSKNIEGILRTIKNLTEKRQDFLLRIIADDNIKPTQNLIHEYGLNGFVVLESTKTSSEVAKAMQQASFFLLYSNYETFSVVLAEAWATGLPAVYSKCGGLTEINNRHVGIQVESRNDKQLEKVLDHMLDTYHQYNPSTISQFAKSKFDSKQVGKAFFELYKSVINQ